MRRQDQLESVALPNSSVIPNVHEGTSLSMANDQSKLTAATRRAIDEAGYQLESLLGGGSYGGVFAAKEKANGRRVAIKVVWDPGNENTLRAFQREVRLLASDHVPRDVMPILLATSPDDPNIQPFHVMERIDGRELHQHARTPRPLKPLEKIELIERLLYAVHRLHESNVVHGDIKPQNVLVAVERIYFVDFGMACRRDEVYASLNSVVGPRGTPGFQTDDLAAGNRRPQTSDDIWSAAAVGFFLFTNKDVEKFRRGPATNGTPAAFDMRAIDQEMRSHGVPTRVRRILLKGLRQKDSRKKVDPNVYASAEAMADDLRRLRQARSRQRQRLVYALITALLMVAVGGVGLRGWTLYWAEREARDVQRLVELQHEVQRLPNNDEPAVAQWLDKAEEAAERRRQALAVNDTAAARTELAEVLAAYRAAIDTANGIQNTRPLRLALGEALHHTPWVESSTVIRDAKSLLDEQYNAIGKLIDGGDIDQARAQLGQLHESFAQLAKDNVLAAEAARAERQFAQLQDGVTDRLRSQDGYQQITSLATDASDAWTQGDWKQAQDLFGVAHTKLEEWLAANETAAERSTRLAAQTEARLARETELSEQIQRLASERDQLDARVEALNEQVTNLNDEWLKDRTLARSRYAQLNDELATAKTDLASLQEQLDALNVARAALNQQLADAQAEVESWKKQAEASQSAVTSWQAKAREANEAVTKLSQEAERLRQALATANTTPSAPGRITRANRPVVASSTKPGETWKSPTGVECVLIPAGEFTMGSPESEESRDDDEHAHRVRITQPFLMAKHETTQGLYQQVTGENPSRFADVSGEDTSQFPVENVSWLDAVAFCNQLSVREGLEPYYAINGTTVRIVGGNGWRLPTEVEWEYMARAGSTTPFPWGSTLNGREANIDGDYPYGTTTKGPDLQRTTTVGSYEPNAWGVYDSVGNVWESRTTRTSTASHQRTTR